MTTLTYSLSRPSAGVASSFNWDPDDLAPSELLAQLFSRILKTSVTAEPQASFRDLTSLKEDWDGYGARAIGADTRANAQALLSLFAWYAPSLSAPEIVPHSNGTLSLEWDADSHEAYIEIGRTRLSGYVRSSEGITYLIEGRANEVDGALPYFIEMCLCPAASSAPPVSQWEMAANARMVG